MIRSATSQKPARLNRRGKRLLVPGNPKASKQLNKGKQDQKKLAPKSPKVESRGDEKSASNGEIATKGKAGDMPNPKIRKSPVKMPNKKKAAHITVMADEPPRMGRPTKYSQEIADEICELVAIRTPLFKICEMPHMPTERTVYCWRRDRGDFSQSYARAKEHRAEFEK